MPSKQPVVEGLGEVGRGAEIGHQVVRDERVRRRAVNGTHHQRLKRRGGVGVDLVNLGDGLRGPILWGSGLHGGKVNRRGFASEFTVDEQRGSVSRGDAERAVEKVARLFLSQVNRIVAVEFAPSALEVEGTLQVGVANGAHASEGLVHKLFCVHGAHAAEQAELGRGLGGGPSCDPSCNSAVLFGRHVVGGHHVHGFHAEEGGHAEGRTLSVGGDDARGRVGHVACGHQTNSVHTGHVDPDKVVESHGKVVVV